MNPAFHTIARLPRRGFWVAVHRCFGLATAIFIAVAALTGSILAFRVELDAWINPPEKVAPLGRELLDPLVLRQRALELAPGARVDWVNLEPVAEQAYRVWLRHDDEASGTYPPLPRLLLDPYTGDQIWRDSAGATGSGGYPYWPLTRHNLLDFVYALHYSLTLPGKIGVWLMGIVALIWTLDCVVALLLTLPVSKSRASQKSFWRRWAPAWKLKWPSSGFRFHFNLHRAAGLWTWLVLLMFAWSSVGFNLAEEIYNPVMKGVFGMEVAFPKYPLLEKAIPGPPIDWDDARTVGRRLMREQARIRGFSAGREGALSYDSARGLYTYCIHSNLDLASWCGTRTVFRATDGKLAGFNASTGHGNAATAFTSWTASLHMAAVGGLPIKIAVSLMGLITTMLATTGIYLWWKKRNARRQLRPLQKAIVE